MLGQQIDTRHTKRVFHLNKKSLACPGSLPHRAWRSVGAGPLSVHAPRLLAKIHEPGPELVEAIMRTAMMLREQLYHPAGKLRPSALFANSRELIEVGLVEY